MLAGCHALVNIDGDLVGDPLEKAAFNAAQWSLTSASGTVKCESGAASGRAKQTITQLHKHHFNSDLKRMSVVAEVARSGAKLRFVVVKGAPEVLKPLFLDCPASYDQQYNAYAAKGARIIALGIKQLDSGMTAAQLRAMPRSEVRSRHISVALQVVCAVTSPALLCALPALASLCSRDASATWRMDR